MKDKIIEILDESIPNHFDISEANDCLYIRDEKLEEYLNEVADRILELIEGNDYKNCIE